MHSKIWRNAFQNWRENMSLTQQAAPPPVEERVRRVSPIRKLLVRPEMGSIAGAIAVWIFFAIVAGNNGFLSLRGTSSYLSISADRSEERRVGKEWRSLLAV